MASGDATGNEFLSNDLLVARRNEACPMGLPSKSGIYADRAEGAELWDVEGKRYIDYVKSAKLANEDEPILVPGDKERAVKAKHLQLVSGDHPAHRRSAHPRFDHLSHQGHRPLREHSVEGSLQT